MGTSLKLNVAAYGLADEAGDWNTTIWYNQVGINECRANHFLSYETDQQVNNIGLPSLHIDQMTFGGTQEFHAKVQKNHCKK